ncbi:MAG: beta-N-acetylhexosaminidase, partial [Victivallales bacterium]|nr:beta-N-acetylhexosaminidase [Victivallales bacterium]
MEYKRYNKIQDNGFSDTTAWMKRVLLTAALAFSANCFAAKTSSALPYNVSNGNLAMTISKDGHFGIYYKGKPIIQKGGLEISDKGWRLAISPRGRYAVTEEQKDDIKEIRLFTKNDKIYSDCQVFKLGTDKVECSIDYAVKDKTHVKFAVYELYLNKNMLKGLAFSGESCPPGGTAETINGIFREDLPYCVIPDARKLSMEIGSQELTFETSGQISGDIFSSEGIWRLRNICKRNWGTPTFTLIHSLTLKPGIGVKTRLSWSLEIKEKSGSKAEAVYAVNGMKRGLVALLGETKAQSVFSKLPADIMEQPQILWDALTAAEKQWKAQEAEKAKKVFIIPEPRKMKLGKGRLALPAEVLVSTASDLSADDQTGLEILQEELKACCNVSGKFVPKAKAAQIIIGEPWRNPEAAESLKTWGIKLDAKDPGPEGYVLKVTPEVAVVAGSDPAGTFYGIQSLIQLLRRTKDGQAFIPEVEIRDWPLLKRRGFYIEMSGNKKLFPYARRMIRRVAARYKANIISIGECANAYERFRWKCHPEINTNPNYMTMEELGKEADYARRHFLEFLAIAPSLSHMESLAKIYPHIAEAPPGTPTNTGILGLAYCPSNPDSYKLLFEFWDEMITALKPKYMRIGHDELSHIGICPRCKGKTHAELFAGDIIKLHKWLKARGVTPIMSHDMLLSREEWSKKAPPNRLYVANGTSTKGYPYGTDAAIDMIPKDIIIGVWQYRLTDKFPSFKYFMDKGFRVMGACW